MRPKTRFFIFILIGGFWVALLAKQWAIYQRVPKNYEWNAVDSFFKAHAQEDDLLLFEPTWLAGYAQDWGRLGSYSVVKPQEIFHQSYPPSSALWLLSMSGRSSSLAHRLEKAGFAKQATYSLYSAQIALYHLPSSPVSYDFLRTLPLAQAFVDYGDGKLEYAKWSEKSGVFEDNPVEWNQISVRTEKFRRQSRRCIWFHPLQTGVKTLSFEDVPLGKTLRIFGGIVDDGLRTPPGSPVHLFVKIGEEKLAQLEFKDTDDSFDRRIDLGRFQGTRQEVVFETQTGDQAQRHFCFAAWSEA